MMIPLALFLAAAAPQWTLPDDAVPVSHAIEITVDPRQPMFTGVATIAVDLASAMDVVWVNGRDITVQRASVGTTGGSARAQVQFAGNEFIGVSTGKPLGPGRVTLTFHYTAKLSNTAKSGPYRRQTAGDWYAFTVFTPIDARRAFPCFDEPRFKTPWKMAIRVQTGDKAFANGPELEVVKEARGRKLIRFAPTQKIAAEVVAFAVGPFDVYDGGRAGHRNTAVRVITPRGRAAEGKIAAESTRRVLPLLEEYTGIPYPWDKLDHVALPEGAFGAVENPGLITYLARSLLLAPDAPEEKVRSLDGLEAHELAHQWFGNLVTQATWDDVWLSEGFATWFSADVLDPDHARLAARRERIMAADDGPKSHAVRNPKHTRAEMESVYDQFPYQKGAAILLTLEGWLGKEKLRDGLRAYLRKHAAGNARSADLADELGEGVGPVLQSMLDHKGVPVVEGRVDCGRGVAVLTQPASSFQMLPVCFRTDGDFRACAVMNNPVVEVPLKGCPAWVLWNAGGMGYFHTQWADESKLPPTASLTEAERVTQELDLKRGKGR